MKALLLAGFLAFPLALPAKGKAPEPSPAELVRWLLGHQDDLRDIPFAEVVLAATGKRIIPVDPGRDAAMLQKLGDALDATLAALNDPAHAIHRAGRVNEASHFIEDEIRRQLNRIPGWKCTIPLTAGGHELRSGYPDLRVVTDTGVVMYLDPKLHDAGSRGSSFRTFYYEPRMLTGKIQDDAMQMLVGVEHDGGGDSATMRFERWELIDVSKLRVSLKAEFQSSNAGIYRPEMIVGRSVK